ncbi:D-alanyl-D-alanine carboxypeptidase/D-alanyl-D-alanine-endopeptidase, partial [candidate division WOR-3 bacterium]
MILFLFSIAFIDSVLIGAQVGICFYDLTGDSFLLCYHHDQNFLPASNLKLFTTASALFLLGPDFRFQTRFALDSDTNLYILGGGDPTLSRAKLLHELKQITQRFPIQRIFLHGRAIHGFRYPWGWSWHYLDAAYAPRLSGIILDKNTFELILKPGTEVGETINYTYRPQLNDILIVNRATTYPPDSGFKIDLYRELGANRVHLYGGIGLSSPDKKIPISLADPLQSHRELIARMLGCEVLILSGEDSLPELTTIDSILSPPLIEILHEMNTESENIYAEAILNRLANAETTRSTLNAGIQAEKNLLVRLGI